jgi:rubrerythrin
MVSQSENSFGTTQENLQYAIEGESYESTTMYLEFARIAKEEGFNEASQLFNGIGKIEIEHEKMFQMLLDRLHAQAKFESDGEEESWICEECGHVHYGKKALKVCPVCKHPQEYQSRLNSKK